MRKRQRGSVLLKDLAALTPPAVVCVAFIVGLVLLLRREMAPKRRVREGARREADISGNNGIIDANEAASAARSDEDPVGNRAGNPAGNSAERDQPRRSSGDHGSLH
jgi:hypothetical protein